MNDWSFPLLFAVLLCGHTLKIAGRSATTRDAIHAGCLAAIDAVFLFVLATFFSLAGVASGNHEVIDFGRFFGKAAIIVALFAIILLCLSIWNRRNKRKKASKAAMFRPRKFRYATHVPIPVASA